MAATMVAARLQALTCIRAVPFTTRSIMTSSSVIRPMAASLATPRLAPVPLTMITANLRLFHSSPAASKAKSKKNKPSSNPFKPLRPKQSSPSSYKQPAAPRPGHPPMQLAEPVVLYEGPPIFRPAWNYIISGIFIGCGLYISVQIFNRLSWPLNIEDAKLVPWQVRIPLSAAVLAAFTFLGTGVKFKSSKHITRMILYQAENGIPYVKIRTCTRSWIPRHMFKEFKRVRLPSVTQFFPSNIDISPRIGTEFSVPLSEVSRRAGSAVSQGTLSRRLKGHERGYMVLEIGRIYYSVDASGTVSPVHPGEENKWSLPFFGRWLVWRFVRGAPEEPPKFSDRRAFDALIPLKEL